MANLHGSIDPVAWQNPLHPDQLSSKPIPNWTPLYTAAPVAQQYEAGDVASAAAQGFWDGVASVAQQPQKLEDVEQYRMQMAGISTAAIGYWKEGDPIHPDYDTPALRDVAKLYAKYAALYKAQQPQAEDEPSNCTQCSNADSWGTPDKPVCLSCKAGSEWEPLNKSSVNPNKQPQSRPDFTDEWTGYLKDGETPFERFLRERKDLNALTKLYQRVLEENERLKAQQPQAETDNHEAQGQLEFLDKKNNALSAAIRKVMARLADLLDEDQFKEIEEIVSFAGVQPQAEAVPDAIHATLTTGPAPWTNTRVPQAAFDVARAVFGTTSAQDDAKVYQVLQAALHQIAAPRQAEAVPSEVQIEAACEAVAGALGDAYDCTRVWSAWSYGTMSPEDFSRVSEDGDRVREIALAALGAAGLKVTP